MEKDRLLAFSDGVIAVIITIMVLELKVPQGTNLAVLESNVPGVPELCAQLRVCRHLLEQPSASVSRGPPCEWSDLVLAVAGAILDQVDGPAPSVAPRC
jgi:hypothetical protein